MSVAINTSALGGHNNQGNWKRKTSDDEDGLDIKKSKNSWYVTLESESPVPTDEDEESIYTVQGNETEYARDTSDTSTHAWISSSESDDDDDVSVHVEYELDSRSENESSFAVMSSSSEPENILSVQFLSFCESEGLADDSDVSRSSIDFEVKRVDFQTCVQCKTTNNNPLFRYCNRCYQVKKTHYPRNRPRRKSRNQKQQRKKFSSTRTPLSSTQELCEMDSGIVMSQTEIEPEVPSNQCNSGIPSSQCDSGLASSQDLDKATQDSQSAEESAAIFKPTACSQSSGLSSMTVSSTGAASQALERDEIDCGGTSPDYDTDIIYSPDDLISSGLNQTKDKDDKSQAERSSSSKDKTTPLSAQSKELQSRRKEHGNVVASIPKTKTESEQQVQGGDNMCNICTVNPKNGAFVHGRIIHMYCCYRCAKKVWVTNDHRCPICNRQVTQILKTFFV